MGDDVLARLAHAATLTASDVDGATRAVKCALLPPVAAALHRGGPQVLYADVLRALACGRAGEGDGSDGALAAAIARLGASVAAASARLQELVAHVAVHHAPESVPAAALAAAVAKTMAEYRGGLLHLLRVCAYHAMCLNAARKWGALVAPLPATTPTRPDPVAGGPPDPFEWQREHAGAITTRLAAVVARPRNLHRQHRLHSRYQQRATIVDSAVDVARGAMTKAVRVDTAPDMDPHRMTTVDVFLAHRGDGTAEGCAELGVPFAIEVIRVPHQATLDPALAASTTLNARDAARAAATAEVPGAPGAPAVRLAPTVAVPAPTAIASQPRAHPTSAWLLGLDYTAHSDLILSPYFPDACGVHDGADGAGVGDGVADGAAGAVTAVVGPTTLFMLEHIPHAVPLSQMLTSCGPLPAGSPLLRHIVVELLAALHDIETQCTVDVEGDGIGPQHVYLSEQGARLTLRGVRWSSPLPSSPPITLARALAQRSRVLLSCFHSIVRACLRAPQHGDLVAVHDPAAAGWPCLLPSRLSAILAAATQRGAVPPPPPTALAPADVGDLAAAMDRRDQGGGGELARWVDLHAPKPNSLNLNKVTRARLPEC